MIGRRLLKIGGRLAGSPICNAVALSRASHADDVDANTLTEWVLEEAGKRGVALSPEYASRIVQIACKPRRAANAGRMAVLACYYNPAGFANLRRNYLRFLSHAASFGLPVFTAEVAFDGQDFPTSNAYLQIRAGRDHVMWQKERLLNLLAESIPGQYQRLAWIDADMIMLDPHWPEHAAAALSQCPVVQLWGTVHYTDQNGSLFEKRNSVGDGACRYLAGEPCCPGGAWAARRGVFPLYDKHIVGSGDATTVEGWTGMARPKCLERMNEAMRRDFQPWAAAAHRKVRSQIACLHGDIVHMWHGDRENRQYVKRWDPLIEGGFDPAAHVTLDSNGLYRWSGPAPLRLRHCVEEYFWNRKEDGGP